MTKKPAGAAKPHVVFGRTSSGAPSPADELTSARDDLAQWREIMSIPEVVALFEQSSGWRAVAEMRVREQRPSGSARDFFEQMMGSRIARLEAGRDEAEAIQRFIDGAAIGGLRAYLRKRPASADCLLWLLAENQRLGMALAASNAAKAKNAHARAWAFDQWRQRADKGQSKASFARMLAPLVKKQFGVSITPDRIARHWIGGD